MDDGGCMLPLPLAMPSPMLSWLTTDRLPLWAIGPPLISGCFGGGDDAGVLNSGPIPPRTVDVARFGMVPAAAASTPFPFHNPLPDGDAVLGIMSRRFGADELPLITAVLNRLFVLVAIFLLNLIWPAMLCRWRRTVAALDPVPPLPAGPAPVPAPASPPADDEGVEQQQQQQQQQDDSESDPCDEPGYRALPPVPQQHGGQPPPPPARVLVLVARPVSAPPSVGPAAAAADSSATDAVVVVIG
uniref:Uncharacterized protein n=1 Tax=Anopheles merus TaxID=30066 RepID=A0A182VMF8_ANOME